jgi:polyisoprenoid-binding protein YceI
VNACVAGFLSRWSAVVLAAATLAAVAATSGVDATRSRITATFRQMNVPVEGGFKVFRGSIDLGAPEYEEELRGKEWFDTQAYPKASFVSSGVISAGGNRFVARGKFTLKGKTQEIKVPFTMRSESGARVFEGELPVSRKTYAIGGAEWNGTLDDEVIVKFRITTAH